jgi:hypothetical protein
MEEQAVRWAAAPHLDVERRAVIVEHFVEALAAAFVPDADSATPPQPATAATPDAVLLGPEGSAVELLAAGERLAARTS